MKTPAVKESKQTAGARTRQKATFKRQMVRACGAVLVWAAFCGAGVHTYAAQPAREVKQVVVDKKIPYDVTYIDLPSKYKGYSENVSPGMEGVQRVEAQVLYEAGKPVKVMAIKTMETARPVPAVVRRGTKEVRTATVDGRQWSASFIYPLKSKGWLSADYYDYAGHNGVDFAAPYGTPVYAAAGGTVTVAGWYGDYGKCVMLKHPDGSETVYAHNSSLLVSNGQTVKQGQQIAKVGTTGNSTGNHLHFELRQNGRFLNPLIYLDKS